MEIKKCSAGHRDKVAEFYDSVTAYLEQTINYPKWTHGLYPGRESVTAAIAEGEQFMCLKEGIIVGAFILNDNPQGNYEKGEWRTRLNCGEYLVIHTLAVRPDMYQKGVGKFMVAYCVRTAKQAGYKGVRLDVVPDNIPARKLYEKSGFLFAGEKDLEREIKEIPRFALYELNFE